MVSAGAVNAAGATRPRLVQKVRSPVGVFRLIEGEVGLWERRGQLGKKVETC